MGRPKIEDQARTVVVSVRMTPALAAAFDVVADRWEMSRSESVLRLVKAQVEHDRRRNGSA